MSTRNASASILMVGCLSTNALIGSAANSMMPNATTLAAIMIETLFAMPTAVMTESSENTISMTIICSTVPSSECTARIAAFSSIGPSNFA